MPAAAVAEEVRIFPLLCLTWCSSRDSCSGYGGGYSGGGGYGGGQGGYGGGGYGSQGSFAGGYGPGCESLPAPKKCINVLTTSSQAATAALPSTKS